MFVRLLCASVGSAIGAKMCSATPGMDLFRVSRLARKARSGTETIVEMLHSLDLSLRQNQKSGMVYGSGLLGFDRFGA